MRCRAVLGFVAGVGLLAACGGSESGVESSGAVAVVPTAARPAPTEVAPATVPPASDSTIATPVGPPDGATVFVDPEGLYSMRLGPTWEETALFRGARAWTVGGPGSFRANVNVIVQPYTLGLPNYIEHGLDGAEVLIDDLDVLGQDVTTGAQGQPIGILEYTGSLQGFDFHFLSVVVVTTTDAVLATFTAGADDFDSLRDSVEPLLRTLAILD